MLKVKNQKTVRRLAQSAFRANRLRNLFALAAVVLTTVLFTGLFTIAGSLVASMEESTMRQVGGSFHGGFKYLTPQQCDKLAAHPSIKESAYTVVLAVAENKELAKRPSEIRYVSSELGAAEMFSLPETGRLPQADDELATDTLVLEKLGIPPELGRRVTLDYTLGGEKHSDTFTLVGFWQGDRLMMASQVWLNRGYVEKQLEAYPPDHQNDIIGTRNLNVNFANSRNIEAKLERVIADSGYSPGEIDIGVNWAYTGNNGSADAGTILGAVLALAMIVFCAYLMISNVFYISVAKDIRFYGLLKSIGATGRQIGTLLRWQALWLCGMGVPLGLLAGYLVGSLLTPLVLSVLNTNVIKIYASPVTFVGAALFAVFTVFISISRPSRLAARVSPMEALRSTEGAGGSKKASKRSRGVSLWKMALDNVLRNKKKALLVTLSLSLSLIILNGAYSMANSFDMDKYLSGRIGSDFAVGDVSNFNVHIHYTNQGTLSQDFLGALAAQDGVESMSNIYFAEPPAAVDPRLLDLPDRAQRALGIEGEWLENMRQTLANPQLLQHIYGLDENVLDRLTILEGVLDREKLASGNYLLAGPFDVPDGKVKYYNVGDRVALTNEKGESREYEVLAIATMPYNISCQHSHPIDPVFYLPSQIFLRDIAQKAPMLTTLEVADSLEPQMEAYLADYCANVNTDMAYNSKASIVAEYENLQRTYKTVGLVISMLVAFVGIMNFINTVITSIMSRKRELAMLQSIGLTTRQTQAMLIFEGLVYTALAAAFALTVGSALAYVGIGGLGGGSSYTTIRFTVVPALLCLPVLAAISVLVPDVSGNILNKNSLVERLREVE